MKVAVVGATGMVGTVMIVITSYSIHYTKLYDGYRLFLLLSSKGLLSFYLSVLPAI